MTSNCNPFSSLSVAARRYSITVVDSSVSQVPSVATVKTSSITLDRVLRVLNLSFNLLSVNQITKSLNCSVTFFSLSLCFSGPLDEGDNWWGC